MMTMMMVARRVPLAERRAVTTMMMMVPREAARKEALALARALARLVEALKSNKTLCQCPFCLSHPTTLCFDVFRAAEKANPALNLPRAVARRVQELNESAGHHSNL